CLKAIGGAFGVGSISQYVGAVSNLSADLAMMLEGYGNMKANTPYLKETFQYLDLPNTMFKGDSASFKQTDGNYEVEFKNVSFKYPGSENWALHRISIKIKSGRRLAIVGENGSGKTTFIKRLSRLYDPQEGEILLNGTDIRQYRYDEYLNLLSVVFQDFELMCASLGANVAAGQHWDKDRAAKALADAGFESRLEQMPKGLDTLLYKDLSEKGIEVSGGEAQKIAIARALYKDAPFIILDEPTAALDPVAEAEIYSNFDAIAADRTAIYISHRLSSCRFCDEIAVFDNGSIVQTGTHEDLVKDESGKYFELWNAQAQYYTE
ncbi:MAG: ABC transporter ATP-binding protein, partial [Erysipelotrichaceae bacterium]|nr:ABC transporter ATP-binding protein [Erysipelotrichaceae bacterium]